MQTIHLQVKEGFENNVLDVLNGLKDLMIEKIEIKDEQFLKDKKELEETLKDYLENGEENSLSQEENKVEKEKLLAKL